MCIYMYVIVHIHILYLCTYMHTHTYTHRVLCDKNFLLWNGPLPPRPLRDFSQRSQFFPPEYQDLVASALLTRLEDKTYMEKVVKYLSIIQSGRPRECAGQNAQMFKGLFKFLGPRALDAFMPFLKSGM